MYYEGGKSKSEFRPSPNNAGVSLFTPSVNKDERNAPSKDWLVIFFFTFLKRCVVFNLLFWSKNASEEPGGTGRSVLSFSYYGPANDWLMGTWSATGTPSTWSICTVNVLFYLFLPTAYFFYGHNGKWKGGGRWPTTKTRPSTDDWWNAVPMCTEDVFPRYISESHFQIGRCFKLKNNMN